MGILNSYKSYYIVCMKQNNVGIFLWRGMQSKEIDWRKANDLILDSKFRKEDRVDKDHKKSVLVSSTDSFFGNDLLTKKQSEKNAED